MSHDEGPRYRGGREITGPPMVPGHTVATRRVQLTEAESADIADRMRAAADATPPGALLRVPPAPQRYEGPETWERVLDALKNVMVIITCAVLLYTVWRGYVALAALGESLEQVRSSWITP